jgi:hypothetical protein
MVNDRPGIMGTCINLPNGDLCENVSNRARPTGDERITVIVIISIRIEGNTALLLKVEKKGVSSLC